MTDLYTVMIGKGVNTTRAIDWDGLPEQSKRFVIQYGLTQKLNDAHASIAKGETAEIQLAVDEMIDRLIEGTLEIRESSGTRGDPVRKRALQMAFDSLVKSGLKFKPRTERAKAMVDASAKWLQIATEALEYEAALAARAEETEELVPEVVEQAA